MSIFFKSKKDKFLANNPTFIGTKEDFHKYFGGYARNKVQSLTISFKKKIGKCEVCNLTREELKSKGIELDAAHNHGHERKVIIDRLLNEFIEDGLYKVDLNRFEELFISEHAPIEDVITIMCKPCHKKYDNDMEELSKIWHNPKWDGG
ncbi:uncharacterized protein METZ01_LOCUS378511, partial [marine metagenome]